MPGGRDIRAGGAYVELSARGAASVEKAIQGMQAKMRAFGASVQAIGQKLIGIGAGIAALGAGALGAFAAPIKSASDLQETMSKFETVFGDRSDEVKQWGDNFASEVGRSKGEIAKFLASSQDLFVPLGFEAGAAEQMSKELTGLAVDLASFNNTTDEAALGDLQAALTGSGEVMKKYGVLLNEAAVKQELLNRGIDPSKASDQEKVMARYAIILRGTTAAQGDAIRTSGSFANQMKRLNGSFEDAKAAIGEQLLPLVTKIVEHFNRATSFVEEWAKANGELIQTIALVAAGVTAAGIAVAALGVGFVVVGSVLSGVATVFGTIATVVGALLSPMGLLTAAMVGIGAAMLHFTGAGGQALDWLRDKFGELADVAKESFAGISAALKGGEIALAGKILWLTLKSLWQEGIASLNSVWQSFKASTLQIWNELVTGLAMYWTDFIAKFQMGLATIQANLKKGIAVIGVKTGILSEKEGAAQVADADKELGKKVNELEANRRAISAGLAGDLANEIDAINKKREASMKKAEADIAATKAELKAAIAEANRAADRVGGKLGGDGPATVSKADQLAKEAQERAGKLKSIGTFDANILGRLGFTAAPKPSSHEQEHANAAKETAKNSGKQVAALNKIERKLNDMDGLRYV